MGGIPPARCHKQTRHGKNPVCHDSKNKTLEHPGRQVLFLLMIVLLVSTLKLSELTQLFSTSFISLWCKHHAFLFASGIFQKSQPNPDKKSNRIYEISKNSAHLRYDHLFPWNAFVLPACRCYRLDQTHRFGWHFATTTRKLIFARWGCFIAGMSFACLAPPHHAHHVRRLRK